MAADSRSVVCVVVYAYKCNQNKQTKKKTKIDLYLLVDQQRPAFSASAAKLHPNPNCETLLKLDQLPAPAAAKSDSDSEAGAASETASAAPAVTPPPLSVAVEVTVPSTPGNSTGCNCFGGNKGSKGKKRWTSSTDTPEMSEVYCPSCEDGANETPACLSKMPDKRQTRLKPKPPSILCVESELVVGKRGSLRLGENKRSKGNNITRSVSLSAADRRTSVPIPVLPKKAAAPVRVRLTKKELDKGTKDKDKEKDKENDKKSSNQKGNLLSRMSPKRLRNAKASDKEKEKDKEKDKPKEKSKVPVKTKIPQSSAINGNGNGSSNNNNNAKAVSAASKTEEYEIADDATSLNGESAELGDGAGGGAAKMAILSESDSKLMISVRGREELPVVEQSTSSAPTSTSPSPPVQRFEKCLRVPVKSESHPLQLDQPDQADNATNDNNHDEELGATAAAAAAVTPLLNGAADVANGNQPASSATLPRTAKQSYYHKVLHLVPKRRTPDGTNIYYWCDLPKKALKGYISTSTMLIDSFRLPWLSPFCMYLL